MAIIRSSQEPLARCILERMILCALGRQRGLALAELEALYGASALRVISDGAVALVDGPAPQLELGGSIKVAKVLHEFSNPTLAAGSRYIARKIPEHLTYLPEGKVTFGLSLYGISGSAADVNRSALFIKKAIKSADRSVRIVPNNDPHLSSAQVIHNGLTGDRGMELLLVRDGDKMLLAQTIHEQDIEGYSARDHGRPFRDARVGMLPPKLAQIMIHLASSNDSLPARISALSAEQSELTASTSRDESTQETSSDTLPILLDPFCGTGVVLQEAALMGLGVYGTDLSERMIRYTRDNLNWLQDVAHIHAQVYFHQADATAETWRQPIDMVVCEGYLGEPLITEPPREKLESIMHECNATARGFLKNIAPQIQSGTPLCVALPAWHTKTGIRHLSVLDDLESLGYNRVDFVHADREDLIYHREGQIVGRELVVLTRS